MSPHPSPLVLGVNAAHDASACVLAGGEIVAAIAEERLTRRKHQDGLPRHAIAHCLAAAGLPDLDAVDCIVVNEYAQTDVSAELTIRSGVMTPVITNPSHHLLHAYYAWSASGRRDTAILVADGSGYAYGEYARRASPLLGPKPAHDDLWEAESMYAARAGALEVVEKRWGLWAASRPFLRFPSLGHMFSAASQYIFGHMHHAGKTMGLAPYGDASALPDPIVRHTEDGLVIDTEWVLRLPPRSALAAHLDPVCRNVAAKVQAELEDAMLYLVRDLHARTGLRHLCLSGGVALNSVANARIIREGSFDELFVTPAAGDSGIAIGAAIFGHQRLTGRVPVWDRYRDYLGCPPGADGSARALDARAPLVSWTQPSDAAAQAAADIAAGLVIGWFEGGSELGPRALGHRSILADPRMASMRDHLNASVKYREPFRPYAASVLTERAPDYFDMSWRDPFMLTVAPVRSDQRASIPAVSHVDGTCRVQTVDPDHPGDYRRVIEAFGALTGVPLILNTSFNVRGEPIVETPDDAVRCFLACNLDVLYLEGHRVTKIVFAAASETHALVPHLTEGISLVAQTGRRGDGWSGTKYVVRTRTGYRHPITPEQHHVLHAIDGRRTVRALSEMLPTLGPAGIDRHLQGLQVSGLVSFARGST